MSDKHLDRSVVIDRLRPAVDRYQFFGHDAFIGDGTFLWYASMRFPHIPRSSIFYDAIVEAKILWPNDAGGIEWVGCLQEVFPQSDQFANDTTGSISIDAVQLTTLIDAVLDSLATGVLAASLDDAVEPFIPYASAPDS